MSREQCHSFTCVCLDSYSKRYDDKIASVYAKYDDDNDNFLTFDNFLKFYEDSAKDRASTVWSNLKNFGVTGDFQFPN